MASTEASRSQQPLQPIRMRKKFILCFDGTGNKFQGDGGDSNILKIYSMLDRTDKTTYHYYQPGIGTYTNKTSLNTEGVIGKIHSALSKAKDQAIGTTLAEHVMAGYKFLMRYYEDGDDIYFFGFSRGAYVARFLAELLDHTGLLSAGNEEMVRFVWKAFSKWQKRQGDQAEGDKLFKFMKAFRETFSRPVRRIRFLGLFDTVNSVSGFESAWLSRAKKYPYTARSRAVVIRHAVSIDERRAKFRQDLISQKKQTVNQHSHHHHFKHFDKPLGLPKFAGQNSLTVGPPEDDHMNERFSRSRSRGRSIARDSSTSRCASVGAKSDCDSAEDGEVSDDEADENLPQDIEEVWFPGCHADIGGGWPPDGPEKMTLAHGPLVWMVWEAKKAGLNFDEDKMRALKCYYDPSDVQPSQPGPLAGMVPHFQINNEDVQDDAPDTVDRQTSALADPEDDQSFVKTLHTASEQGQIHDSLSFNRGVGTGSVLAWKIMEFLPFRRMDLQPDGSWKAIRFPLPMGETRDVPDDVKIHHTVLRRMQADETYRPGNLIIGGGGKVAKVAPKKYGMGEWECHKGEGHPIEEIHVRAKKPGEANGEPPKDEPVRSEKAAQKATKKESKLDKKNEKKNNKQRRKDRKAGGTGNSKQKDTTALLAPAEFAPMPQLPKIEVNGS